LSDLPEVLYERPKTMNTIANKPIHEVAVAASEALGMSVELLRGPRRDWLTHRPRLLVWAALSLGGYSTTEIAGEFTRSYTAILKARKVWQGHEQCCAAFRRDLGRLCDVLGIRRTVYISNSDPETPKLGYVALEMLPLSGLFSPEFSARNPNPDYLVGTLPVYDSIETLRIDFPDCPYMTIPLKNPKADK
jgi:hypothetical protein